MPAPKNLAAHVRDGTFRARRHHAQLAGPVVPWPQLAALQAQYAAASSEPERRAIGVAFERVVRELQEAGAHADDELSRELERIFSMPPVPLTIADDPAALERYYRAIRGAEKAAAGAAPRAIAAELGVSAATVRRDVAWLRELYPPPLRPLPGEQTDMELWQEWWDRSRAPQAAAGSRSTSTR